MTSRADVQLVIRAKDEATRAFETATAAIENMVRQAGAAGQKAQSSGSQFEEMARSALAVDRAIALLTGKLDGASQGLARQATAIAASKQRLTDLKAQLEGAAAAAQSLQTQIVDATLDGFDATPLREQLRSVSVAMTELRRESAQVERILAMQQSGYSGNVGAIAQLESRTEGLAAASALAKREAAALAEQLERQEAAARRSAAILPTIEKNTGVSRPSGDYDQLVAQIREKAARAAEQEAQAIVRLRAELNPLAVIEARVARETERLAEWQRQGKISADEHAVALRRLGNEFARAKRNIGQDDVDSKERISFLGGLNSHELTNLSYQLNDVFTQIASGTGVLQTLAQQGGQIVQIFPQMGSSLVAALRNPYVLSATALFAALSTSLKSASDQAERLRKVEGIMLQIGGASAQSAQAVAESVRQMELLGFKSEEALGALRRMVTEGLNTTYLQSFASVAKDVAAITGDELPDAMNKVVDAFSRGYNGIADLDNQLQLLTVAEREEIRAMFDSGQAIEARARAFSIFESRAGEVAQKSRGPWKSSIETLKKAFGELFDTLGRADWAQNIASNIETVLRDFNYFLKEVNDLTLEEAEKRLAALEAARAKYPIDKDTKVLTLFGEDNTDEQIEQLRKYVAALKEARASGNLVDEESQARTKRRNDVLAQIRLERELEESGNAARRIAIRGEEAYRAALQETGDTIIANARREQALAKARREESRRAREDAERRSAEFARQIDEQGRGALVSTASQFVGRNENRASDRTVLSEFFKAANVNIDPKMVAWCAAFVNAVLATNNLPTVDQVSAGSDLRARDFLSYGSKVTKPEAGDIVILKRGANGGHVGFFKGFTDNGDVRVLGGNQSNGVNESTFSKNDVLGFRRAPSLSEVAEEQAKDQLKLAERQDDFNAKLDDELAARQRNIDAIEEQQKLSGEALLDAKREQAVLEAYAQIQNQIAGTGVEISEDRLKAVRETVEAEFDLLNARERATAALDSAQGERDALLERLDLAERLGDTAMIDQTESAISAIDDAFRKAIDRAIEFWKSVGDTPEARAAIKRLETTRITIGQDTIDRQQRRVEQPVQQIQRIRNELQQQIDFAQNLGQTAVVEQLREQLESVDNQFLRAIDTAIQFWLAQSGPEAQAALLNLQNLRNQVLAAQNEFIITAGQVEDAFAGSLQQGFSVFAQELAETKDVLGSLATAALTFASSFLQKLAEMGMEMVALKLASEIGFGPVAGILNGGGGLKQGATQLIAAGGTLTAAGGTLSAAGGALAASSAPLTAAATLWAATAAQIQAAAVALSVANAISSNAGIFHSGGIVGLASRRRAVSPAWFAGATRYHSGGVAGLKPNEVPIIAERGEEILTRTDPRHRDNMGSADGGQQGGSAMPPISIINTLDAGDFISKGLGTRAGEKAILNFMRANSGAVREAMK